MSNSVYAHLVYGFPVLNDEGTDYAEKDPPKWLSNKNGEALSIEDIVVKLEGIQRPIEEYDGGSDPIIKQKHKDFWQAKRDAEERSGVLLVSHCRDGYPMWILGIKASWKLEHRGGVTELGQTIEAEPEWRDTLKAFCDKAGIPFTEPQWLLAPKSED